MALHAHAGITSSGQAREVERVDRSGIGQGAQGFRSLMPQKVFFPLSVDLLLEVLGVWFYF